MIFPDFIPTWARDWYSRVTNDCGDGCTRILQRDAALRLVTDSTMKKVYESLSRLNLTSDVLKEILNQASWCADISWEDTRDSCRKMNQRKQNLERLLRLASDELSAMEDEEGDGGAVPFVLASLPALFRAMGLDSVTDTRAAYSLTEATLGRCAEALTNPAGLVSVASVRWPCHQLTGVPK